MILRFNQKIREFYLECKFAEREHPRKAGFRFDVTRKLWVTTTHRAAVRLRAFADDGAKAELDRVFIEQALWPHPLTPTKIPLQSYQEDGVMWALTRSKSYLGYDPGLGKTAMAASIWINCRLPQLVYVCPPFLADTVLYEFEKFGAKPPTLLVRSSVIARQDTLTLIKRVARRAPTVLIVDEAHQFKEIGTAKKPVQRTRALIHHVIPHFKKVVWMSGTPIPNGRPMEIYQILNASAPETIDFMNRFDFGLKYCAAYQDEYGWNFDGASNMKEFSHRIKSVFMKRVKKSEVLTELPAKTESLLLIGDNLPAQIGAIDRKLLKMFSPNDEMKVIAENGHTATYRRELGILKAPHAVSYIKDELEATDQAFLIFAIHKEVVKILQNGLQDFEPIVITGDTPVKSRFSLVESFQNDRDKRILIGNIDACGVGFTMTKASRVLFVEASWTPGANDQAADRTHRIGQKNPVQVQYLVFKNSIDRAVIESNLRKKANIAHI